MAMIIAGGFGAEVQAQATVRQLLEAGVPLEDICTFRVNPPGEHHGSLVGGLRGIDDEVQPGRADLRPAENLVAVNVGAGGRDAKTIAAIFRVCGARQIECAEGRWANGAWADFDPTSAPHLIGGRDLGRRGERPRA